MIAPPNRDDRELRTLRLVFDDFGWESAETLAAKRDIPLEVWLAESCVAYAQRHGSGAVSLQPPRFRTTEGEVRKLQIALPSTTWARLDRASLGLDLERLVEHAAISHAAREQEWSETPAAASAPPPGPSSQDPRRVPKGRRLPATLAALAGVVLLPVTLAAAGVSLPAPVDSAFERVGIELPHQAQAPPPAVVLKDPRGIPGRSSRAAYPDSGFAGARTNGQDADDSGDGTKTSGSEPPASEPTPVDTEPIPTAVVPGDVVPDPVVEPETPPEPPADEGGDGGDGDGGGGGDGDGDGDGGGEGDTGPVDVPL